MDTLNGTLELLREELAGSLTGLDKQQTQLRPGGDLAKWNIQQIVGHLRLTYAVTVLAMDARIAKASPTKGKPSLLQYAGQFALIACGYFPTGRKAPPPVTVTEDEPAASGAALAADMGESLVAMDARIAKAETIFGGSKRVISHMVLGPLSITQWRRFHLVHARHHIKQIRAIRREYGV